jgi:hypothetical protein
MDTQKIEGLWTHLHWLGMLAEQGSYTAAASRLGVSKAAMSARREFRWCSAPRAASG